MLSKLKYVPLALALGVIVVTAFVQPAISRGLRDRVKEYSESSRAKAATAEITVPGVTKMSLVHDGIERNFLVYEPPGLSAGNRGAVLVFHGGYGWAAGTMEGDPTRRVAEQQKFLVVYPDSVSGHWTDGRLSTANGPDDVGFVKKLVDVLQRDLGVNPSRVFATGLSNGGVFTHKLACSAPGLMRAIAPIAANLPEELEASCTGVRATPVMMFSGTADRLMPYDGGAGASAADMMLSAPGTAAFWARNNGCGDFGERDLGRGENDGTTITVIRYQGCRSAPVVLVRVNGGGHTWPNSDARKSAISGKVSQDIDASEEMVGFFKRFGL